MNTGVGRAQIGQWYLRWDKGEVFQVVGYNSQTIEIQLFDGEFDEIEAGNWVGLPLGFAEPPEDWTAPVKVIEVEDLDDTEIEGDDEERLSPQPVIAAREASEFVTFPVDKEL